MPSQSQKKFPSFNNSSPLNSSIIHTSLNRPMSSIIHTQIHATRTLIKIHSHFKIQSSRQTIGCITVIHPIHIPFFFFFFFQHSALKHPKIQFTKQYNSPGEEINYFTATNVRISLQLYCSITISLTVSSLRRVCPCSQGRQQGIPLSC